MDHEDVEQLEFKDPPAGLRWWTFCSCGAAFGGPTSELAYANWEQHEAEV